MDVINHSPAMMDYGDKKHGGNPPLFNNTRSITNTVKLRSEDEVSIVNDIFMMSNFIEIDDNRVGLIDETYKYSYLDSSDYRNKYYRPYKDDFLNNRYEHTDMIYSWNFVMTNERGYWLRIRYSILDIIGEVGGVESAIIGFLTFFFSLYTYRGNQAVVYD